MSVVAAASCKNCNRSLQYCGRQILTTSRSSQPLQLPTRQILVSRIKMGNLLARANAVQRKSDAIAKRKSNGAEPTTSAAVEQTRKKRLDEKRSQKKETKSSTKSS
jgi:hypothetical protein